MRSFACIDTVRPTRRLSCAAFTLIELIIAITIMSLLAGAATGMMMFSARQAAQAAEDDQKSFEARDILDEIAIDLSLALNFTETQADAVSLTVPDRNGDGVPESIRYAWIHNEADPRQWYLARQYNGGDAKILADDVRHFDLNYLLKAVSP